MKNIYLKGITRRVAHINLVLSKPPANGPGLLRAEIERQVLLVLVGIPQRGLLLLRNHRQNLGNVQPHHLAANLNFKITHKHKPQRQKRNEELLD